MADENPVVCIRTNKGNIRAELWADASPKTVDNFLQYVDSGFYDDTLFHRVIPNFMIQGGGLDRDMNKKTTRPSIENEATSDKKNKRGTLAMARTQKVDSATSQFFINLSDNDFLDRNGDSPGDYGYATFGQVIEGMDVVDEIASGDTTTRNGRQDVPAEQVVIESIECVS